MNAGGTNLGPPEDPGLPVYPNLEELCRVTGGPVGSTADGKRVYPALLQQFSPPVGLRDRVAVYLMEPNNVALGQGIFDARLIGAWPSDAPGSLPLFATSCCVSGSSSSAAPGH